VYQCTDTVNTALNIDPADAVPIWKQIEEGIRRLVASGAFAPGAAAPSVRDLARDLRINPATVARAYQRLVEAGVLTVRRGEGTFVAEEPPVMPKRERHRALKEGAVRYAALATTLGVPAEDAAQEVRQALERMRPPQEEKR
jgi:GntR family transcriptional regulator